MSNRFTDPIIEFIDETKKETEEPKKNEIFAKICAILIVVAAVFPFGLIFIAICRWLWGFAFPS